jgi:hypothetical protein
MTSKSTFGLVDLNVVRRMLIEQLEETSTRLTSSFILLTQSADSPATPPPTIAIRSGPSGCVIFTTVQD